MNRLTTEFPKENFEIMLNYVYGKEGWAHIRHDGEKEDVPLTQWARTQCLRRGCGEFPAELPEEIDEALCGCMMDAPDCLVALAYCFACQASHLRSRLKLYEDVLFSTDGKELMTLDMLRERIIDLNNAPLTLEELRELAGEPVWLAGCGLNRWDIFSSTTTDGLVCFVKAALPLSQYGKTWAAYRRKPEGYKNEKVD